MLLDMKRRLTLVVGLLFAFILCATSSLRAASPLKWYTLEEAMEAAKKNPKPLLIDLYTDWCGWCKKLDADTFGHEGIAKYIGENFYPVKFNAEQRETVKFLGKEYTPDAKERTHPLAMALTAGRLSYPMLVYMKADGQLITTVPGYAAPQQIEPILKFIATGAYETKTWEEFSKDFKSTL